MAEEESPTEGVENTGEGTTENGSNGEGTPSQSAIDKAVAEARKAEETKNKHIFERMSKRQEKMLSAMKENEMDVTEFQTEGDIESRVQAELQSHEDLNALIQELPELSAHKAQILAMSKDPSRANIPIKTIAMEAVGLEALLQMGSKLEQKATKESKQSKTGGGSKTNPKTKSYDQMTPAEFEAAKEAVYAKA